MDKIKAFKSTILGLAMLIFDGVLYYKGLATDKTVVYGLFCVGLGLIFSGDKFIERLEIFFFDKVTFKKEDNDEQPK